MGGLTVQHRADGTVVIALEGRMDAETAEALEARLDHVLTCEPNLIVFDLALVEYISSAGIRLILKARTNLNRRGRKVVAAAANPQAQRVFAAIGNLAFDAQIADLAELDQYQPDS